MENTPSPATPQEIPIQAVDADQLPRENGWSYDEICRIIGSMYLDSHHRVSILTEQFDAVSNKYQQEILRVRAEVEDKENKINLLQRELELMRAKPGNTITSGDDRQIPMQSS